MTNTTINPPEETPGCDCGALLEQGQIRCRKCLARDRRAHRTNSCHHRIGSPTWSAL